MLRLGVLVLLIGACRHHPRAADAPSCSWHTEKPATGQHTRCVATDPWCGPDTLRDCLDDLHYDRRGSRRPIANSAPSSSAPSCSYDGQCAIVRGCGPYRCQYAQPPPAPGSNAPVIDEGSFTCGMDLAAEQKFRTRLCGCVDHACTWFEQ